MYKTINMPIIAKKFEIGILKIKASFCHLSFPIIPKIIDRILKRVSPSFTGLIMGRSNHPVACLLKLLF